MARYYREVMRLGCLFDGSVVISSDYFKAFISKLRLILGGRMREFEPLLDRARREAILRMKEKAVFWGAKRIINLRIECSSVSWSWWWSAIFTYCRSLGLWHWY